MSITPRHLAGLAGNYTFADLHPIPTTTPVISRKTSNSRTKTIDQADLALRTVLPLTPPSSDSEKVGNDGKVKVRDFGAGRRVILEEEDDDEGEAGPQASVTVDFEVEPERDVVVKQEQPVQPRPAVETQLVPPPPDSLAPNPETTSSTAKTTEDKRSRLLSKLGRHLYLYRLSQTRQKRSRVTGGQARVVKALLALDREERAQSSGKSAKQEQKKESEEAVDEVGDMLINHLKGMLVAKTPVLVDSPLPITTSSTLSEVKAEDKLEEDQDVIEVKPEPTSTPFPTFEREPPLFLRRPPTPGSNPIRYPRGYIPPTPAADDSSLTGEEVSVEFIKAIPRVVKTMQGMTGKMRRVFEGEAWVRALDDQVKACLVESDIEDSSAVGVVKKEEGTEEGGMKRMVKDEVERFLVEGKQGEVKWEEGVGRLISRVKVDDEGEEYGDVYVFLDHSNIHHGMISTLVSRPLPNLSLNTKKILNIPILSLLMLRGRRSARDGMHLVASAPLTQGLDTAVKAGWRCCVLKRVEVDKGQVTSSESDEREKEQPNKAGRKGGRKAWTSAIVKDETTTGGSATDSDTPVKPLTLPNLNDPSITSRRMREQAVDELLHLQILQTLLFSPQPGTLVLGTGDAKGGQFNDLGFLGCVKLAVERGWKVELWSWRKGMSRMWREEAKRCGWSRRQFKICELDEWVEEVVMERESSGKRSRRR